MPYLHWETDRRRETIARIIDEEVEKRRKDLESENADMKEKMKKGREPLCSSRPKLVHPIEKAEDCLSIPRPLRTMTEVYNAKWHKKAYSTSKKKSKVFVPEIKNGRLNVATELGQFLMDAAKLYEAISCFRDKKLLEVYLHKNPPLHPRRTLDQSYYWTLKTTKARDRDQVVYRGTTINMELAHRLQVKSQDPAPKWEKIFRSKNKLDTPEWLWDNHTSLHDEKGCEHCRDDIRKISRVIMVDQLWMWILDEHTIFTFFPRRYGINKRDESGVHRSIRGRIAHSRKDQIRSVFDLALIILDECSNTFFDRTKTEVS